MINEIDKYCLGKVVITSHYGLAIVFGVRHISKVKHSFNKHIDNKE